MPQYNDTQQLAQLESSTMEISELDLLDALENAFDEIMMSIIGTFNHDDIINHVIWSSIRHSYNEYPILEAQPVNRMTNQMTHVNSPVFTRDRITPAATPDTGELAEQLMQFQSR